MRYNGNEAAESRSKQSDLIVDYVERKRYKRETALFIGKLLLVFAFALVVLLRFASITEIGHNVNKAQKKYEAAEEENRRLNKELAAKTDLITLENMAKTKFGMKLPDESQKVYYEPESCDRTELYNSFETEEKNADGTKTSLIEKLKRFVGII